MNRKLLSIGFSLAAAAGVAALASGQSAPARSATPQPTNPVPDWALTPGASMTPGAAQITPGPSTTTPGDKSDLYSIPPMTPLGTPAYSTTPAVTISAPSRRPTTLADCGRGRWGGYEALQFTSQKNCEAWVKQHPTGKSGARTTQSSGSSTRRTTPGSTTPTPNPTPKVN